MGAALPSDNADSRPSEGYWAASARPWASLVFVAPLLVVYEVAVLTLGPEAVRNGADAWLRELLKLAGFGQYFLLPVLTVCILLGWHYTTRRPWRVSPATLCGMVVECVVLAICLRMLLRLQGVLMESLAAEIRLSLAERAGVAAGYLGAGIYEELLFRLILLSAALWMLRPMKVHRFSRLVLAVTLTSLIFAAAHYIPPHGDAFGWFSFMFRFLAGAFFSVLFLCRGFGIAAGAHAGYDILVGLPVG